MVKYAKPKKRTEKKGLRPLPPYTIDTFPQKKVEKGEERLKRILNGNSLTPGGEFLRRYSLTVCRFRLAQENKQSTDAIYREICKLEEEAYDFEFKEEDLAAMNRIFREKKISELENLQEKLKEKIGAK